MSDSSQSYINHNFAQRNCDQFAKLQKEAYILKCPVSIQLSLMDHHLALEATCVVFLVAGLDRGYSELDMYECPNWASHSSVPTLSAHYQHQVHSAWSITQSGSSLTGTIMSSF